MKLVYTFLFFSFTTVLFGQTITQPDIIPPSPEAANLGKYAQLPVSYNTGTPQIEIPLHEISVNDMKIPIGLSYHASGIKVTEVASWVGLGWTLNAGGAITRVMRGRPDEATNGYFQSGPWDTWQMMKTWSVGVPTADEMNPSVNDQANQKHTFQYQVTTGQMDLQPDIFMFNFAGYSGKIYFDHNMKPVIVPYTDLKIEHPFDDTNPNDPNGSWIITTPDGIQFIFKNADAEWTTPLNEGSYNQASYFSTWYLSRVQSLKQPGFINFEYNSTPLQAGIETTPNSGVLLHKQDYFNIVPIYLSSMTIDYPVPGVNTCGDDPPYPQGGGTHSYGIYLKYLSRITFTGGSIEFYTSGREDKYQNLNYLGQKLDNILIFDEGHNMVKSASFMYDYGTGRLTLQNVSESGMAPYQFGYYGSLPPPTSFAQDHWGYYNGATTNLSLIPPMTIAEEVNYFGSGDYAVANADRSSSDAQLAGTLNSITYPTGGKRIFAFESNVVTDHVSVPHSVAIDCQGGIKNSSMNDVEQKQYDWFINQQYDTNGQEVDVTSTGFTIPSKNAPNDSLSYEPKTPVHFKFNASNSQGGTIGFVAQILIFKLPITDYRNFVTSFMAGARNTSEFIYPLDPGDYVMVAAASQTGVFLSGTASWDQDATANFKVGGLRIASINDYDNGVLVSRQEFDYSVSGPPVNVPIPVTTETNTGYGVKILQTVSPIDTSGPDQSTPPALPVSSGVLYQPIPTYKLITPCGHLYISSSETNYWLETARGSHIGYGRVEVTQKRFAGDTALVNGSVVHIYNGNENDVLRTLADEIYLNKHRDIVKQVHYDYSYTQNDSTAFMFLSYAPAVEMHISSRVLFSYGFMPDGTPMYSTNAYKYDVIERRFSTFFFYQSKITEKIFDLTNYPKYEITAQTIKKGFDGGTYETSHTFPTETIRTLPNGENVFEQFQYTYNVSELSGLGVKVPTQYTKFSQINTHSQTLVNGVRYQYDGLQLNKIFAYENAKVGVGPTDVTSPYQLKLAQSFNGVGKVIERTGANGIKTSYLWDTNNLNPIAEIQNSAQADVAFTSFENGANEGNWQFNFDQRAAATEHKTGAKCYLFSTGAPSISKGGLTSTASYKISYWAKNGTPAVTNIVSSNDNPVADAQSWKYYEKIISNTTTVTISASAGTQIDELRLCPVGSMMKTINYQPLIGISSVTDANNQTQYYFYDGGGRLQTVKDAFGNIVVNQKYHYQTSGKTLSN